MSASWIAFRGVPSSGVGHELSIRHPGQTSNLTTACPSAADLLRRLRPIHAQCQKPTTAAQQDPTTDSLNQIVGACVQRCRRGETKRLGHREVNHQLEPCRACAWQQRLLTRSRRLAPRVRAQATSQRQLRARKAAARVSYRRDDRLLDPSVDPNKIPTKRRVIPRIKLFLEGELGPTILGILREADAPIATADVVEAVIAHGVYGDAARRTIRERVRARLGLPGTAWSHRRRCSLAPCIAACSNNTTTGDSRNLLDHSNNDDMVYRSRNIHSGDSTPGQRNRISDKAHPSTNIHIRNARCR